MCNAADHGSRPRSMLCILPPHILREIAKNGTAEQRAAALAALAFDQAIRSPARGRRARAATCVGDPAEEGREARSAEAAAHDLQRGGFATTPWKDRAEGGRRGVG